MKKPTRAQLLTAAGSIFAAAAALGSTLLTPEQREMIMGALPYILSLFGL